MYRLNLDWKGNEDYHEPPPIASDVPEIPKYEFPVEIMNAVPEVALKESNEVRIREKQFELAKHGVPYELMVCETFVKYFLSNYPVCAVHKSILLASPGPIYISNRNYFVFNEAYTKKLGYTAEELHAPNFSIETLIPGYGALWMQKELKSWELSYVDFRMKFQVAVGILGDMFSSMMGGKFQLPQYLEMFSDAAKKIGFLKYFIANANIQHFVFPHVYFPKNSDPTIGTCVLKRLGNYFWMVIEDNLPDEFQFDDIVIPRPRIIYKTNISPSIYSVDSNVVYLNLSTMVRGITAWYQKYGGCNM